MRAIACAAAGTLFLLAAAPTLAAPAAAVDPQIVGTWQMNVPGPAGIAIWVWDIRADGTYTFHTEGGVPAPGHSGIITFNAGRWSLTATRGLQWRDGGTYQLGNPDLLIEMGVLGTGVWNRVASGPQAAPSQQQATAAPPRAPQGNPAPRANAARPPGNAAPAGQQGNSDPKAPPAKITPPQADVPQLQQQASAAPQANPAPQANAAPAQPPAASEPSKYLPNPLRMQSKRLGFQFIPTNVVALAKTAAGMVAPGYKDGVLVDIGVQTPPRSTTFHIDFGFYSSRTNEIVTPTTTTSIVEMQVNKANGVPAGRIPSEFIELSAALDLAQMAGMKEGALLGAGLRVIQIGSGRRVLIWSIVEKPKTKDGDRVVYYIDAIQGKLLEGSPDANREKIAPSWEEASGLFRAYAEKQLPQPSTMPETNTRPPNACVIPAACRALEVRDFRAVDRIDGGFPTEQDIKTYDK